MRSSRRWFKVVAASNPMDPARSIVKVIGLSAEATWQAVEELARSLDVTEALLIEAGRSARPVLPELSARSRQPSPRFSQGGLQR